MDLTGIGSIAELGRSILNRVIPDPEQKLQAELALAQLAQNGEFKVLDAQLAAMKAQTDINAVEASSEKLFVSGWRPYIGWICGIGLTYQFLLRPLLPWVSTLLGHPMDAPIALDGSLQELVYGMLGFGLLRSIDKAVPHIAGSK